MMIISKYADVLYPPGKYFQLVFLERYSHYILSQWSRESLKN